MLGIQKYTFLKNISKIIGVILFIKSNFEEVEDIKVSLDTFLKINCQNILIFINIYFYILEVKDDKQEKHKIKRSKMQEENKT